MNVFAKHDFSYAAYMDPPKEYNVLYGWIWNAPVTREGIDEQLEAFARAGMNGLYILPLPKNFRPNFNATFLEPEYLTKEYFDLVRYALEKGKALGMELWLYDEGGWPSGGACGRTKAENPKAVETVLRRREITLAAGDAYVPAADALAAFAGKQRIVSDWQATEDTVIAEYHTARALDGYPNRVDSTNASVIDTFIANTYETHFAALGDMFGTDIDAVFTDEPNMMLGLLPENCFELFEQTYGYDLRDYLYAVYDAGLADTDAACQARIDYGRLLGKLFCRNFGDKLTGWCREHNVAFGGHLNLEHLAEGAAIQTYFSMLAALSTFDVPGVDVIWQQIRYPKDGCAPVQEGYPFFPKIAPSAARQTGKNLTITETFGVFGENLPPDTIRYVLNYQAVRGINIFNPLTTPYGSERMLTASERPAFRPGKPGFEHMRQMNTYFRRLSYLTRLGWAEGDTALYQPCADMWADPATQQAAVTAFTVEGCEMEKQHIAFDIIDDDAIRAAEITPDGLKLGDALYRHIVVPACRFMPQDVQDKIAPYTGKGAPMVEGACDALRIMTRKLDSGRLYFVFNEGEATVEETLALPAGKLYRLNVLTGAVTCEEAAQISLVCGDMAVFFETDMDLPVTAHVRVAETVAVEGFVPVRAQQYVFSAAGAAMQPVAPDVTVDDAFSGEITYRAAYALKDAPKPGERYRIVLEDTAVTAEILLDGAQATVVGTTPMAAEFAFTQQTGEIEITVANTAANEIVAKDEMIHATFPQAEIGPYHATSIEFEKNAPRLHLGSVRIEKLEEA